MSEATQQHLCMLNLKYIQTKLCSLIEIQPERRIRGLNGILPEPLHPKFRMVSSTHESSGGGVSSNVKKFVIESDYSHIVILEVLKGLKLQGWSLLTSNAFMHIDTENTVETNFYFEKVYTDRDHRNLVFDSNPLDFVQPSISASLDSAFDETKEKDIRPNPKQSTSASSTVSPEMAALIMEKSGNQLGPYSFARRHSLLNTQSQRVPGAKSDDNINTDGSVSSNSTGDTGRKMNVSSTISGRLAALKSGEKDKEKEEPGIQLSNAPKVLQKSTSSTPQSTLPSQSHGTVQQSNQSGFRSTGNPSSATPQQRQSISERLAALKNGISSSSSSANSSSFFSTSSTPVTSAVSDDAKKTAEDLRIARGAPPPPTPSEQSDSDAAKSRAAEAGQIPKSLAGKIFSKYRRKSVVSTPIQPPTSSSSSTPYGLLSKNDSADFERTSDRPAVLQSSSNDSMGSIGDNFIPVSFEAKDSQHSSDLVMANNSGNMLGSSSGYVSSSSSSSNSNHGIQRPPSFSPPSRSPSTVPGYSTSISAVPSGATASFSSSPISSAYKDSVQHPLQNFTNVSITEQFSPSNTLQRESTSYSQLSQPPVPIPIAVPVVDSAPSASLPQAQSVSASTPSGQANNSPDGVVLQQNPLSRATPPAKSPLAANPMHGRGSLASTPQQQQLRSPEEEESFNESRVHENEKTQHYSKLGSAFLQSTSLLGSRGGRGGRGRGIK